MSAPHVTVQEPFAVIPEALLYDPKVDDGMVRVYGVLRRHGSDPSNCYPSHRRIAGLTGKSKRSIPAIIGRLVDAGWVSVMHRRDEAGDPTSNAYTVHSSPVVGGSLVRGVYASERAPSTRENAEGYTRQNAPNESKVEREPEEHTSPPLVVEEHARAREEEGVVVEARSAREGQGRDKGRDGLASAWQLKLVRDVVATEGPFNLPFSYDDLDALAASEAQRFLRSRGFDLTPDEYAELMTSANNATARTA